VIHSKSENLRSRQGSADGSSLAPKNKNGRDACAYRPESVCEVVLPANREHTYLEGLDVRGLQALGALGDFEFNRLAIIQ